MTPSGRRGRIRDVTGPTPHSVALITKLPPLVRPENQILIRQKQESKQNSYSDYVKDEKRCDIKALWLQSSDRFFLKAAERTRAKDELRRHKANLSDRRKRLWQMFEIETEQLLREMAHKDTIWDRVEKLREKTGISRENREKKRLTFVAEKLDQLFRDQCDELRTVQSDHLEQQACLERNAQVRSQQEERRQQEEEQRLFEELWEADRRAKVDRENLRFQQWLQRNRDCVQELRQQMDVKVRQRQQEKELKEEEARLLEKQKELHRLDEQQQKELKLKQKQKNHRLISRAVKLKMEQQAREQQKELQLEMTCLQQARNQELAKRQEEAQRKAERCEEQQRYQQYRAEELQRRTKEEKEKEQLREELLKETRMKLEERRGQQNEAKSRLMEEVMEIRNKQLQSKQEAIQQNQAERQREKEKRQKAEVEVKLEQEEERLRRRQASAAYQADLLAQMKHQQELLSQQKDQNDLELQQSLIEEQRYNERKEQLLTESRCPSFRRGLTPAETHCRIHQQKLYQ